MIACHGDDPTQMTAPHRPEAELPTPGASAAAAPPDLPPRALHARLLENAAQRRLRGLERLRNQRLEDAGYWLGAAPQAVRKASALREEKSFAPIP